MWRPRRREPGAGGGPGTRASGLLVVGITGLAVSVVVVTPDEEHRQTRDDDDPGIRLRPEGDQHLVRERHVDIQRRPEGAEACG